MQTDKRQEAVQPSGEAVALESNFLGLNPSPAAGSMVVLGESSNHTQPEGCLASHHHLGARDSLSVAWTVTMVYKAG